MRHAVFSDIHSNWEALETALDYLKKDKIDETWVLGDTIGYGANPNECFGWMVQDARVALAGNHERAVVDSKILEWFSDEARVAAEWTRGVLKPEYGDKIRELPFLHVNLFATMAHASPDEPQEFRYLFSFKDTRASFPSFETPLCFVGHTHVPSVFNESSESVRYLTPGSYELERNERYILNPGSVGQPRDRDPRLAFGIFDDLKWTFEIVRLEYDNRKAADKIRRAGLPAYLADRLL
jgi:diadenosine tetraphosphatase ApaH/serine/threonine PP2A family protein phosphatase